MRIADMDEFKAKLLEARDAIPLTCPPERYGFGVERPNKHGNSMRAGIRIALRCMEQTPTIDRENLRPTGEWIKIAPHKIICSNCKEEPVYANLEGYILTKCCPNCGACMRKENSNDN